MKPKRFTVKILIVVLLLVLTGIQPVEAYFSANQQEPIIVYAIYPDYDRFAQAASRIDIWTVDHKTHTFQAMVSPSDYDWLIEQNFSVTINQEANAQSVTEPARACYRPITVLYETLTNINLVYPDLTELIQYGTSYEGRPLWALRIGNENTVGTKPRFLLLAGTHGREMISPETAMVFIEFLLNGYRSDPEIATIVDWQEIYVIVSANPDGHVRNEAYYSWWRKNTNPTSPCSSGTYGVDLNRNHDFQWGVAGASDNPCSDVFRGPSPSSEPETVALQNLVRSLFPDQRGPNLTDAAPASTAGVFVTVHSFANLILWPWGDTFTQAPNSQELTVLGQRMAQYNGYVPSQSIELYPTSGTSDDWAYGELGIAAYTFEIGGENDGFNPSCSRYEPLIQPNLPALLYAARVSFAPYMMPAGPEVIRVSLDKSIIKPGEPIGITASAVDQPISGGNAVVDMRLFIDNPPWAGGTAINLQPADGEFNSSEETGNYLLAVANLAEGQHILLVQALDDQGNWGALGAISIWIGERDFIPFVSR